MRLRSVTPFRSVLASWIISSTSSTILTASCSEPLSAQVTAAFATAAASASLPLISLRQPLRGFSVCTHGVLRLSFHDRMHALSAAEVERNVRAPQIRVYERCRPPGGTLNRSGVGVVCCSLYIVIGRANLGLRRSSQPELHNANRCPSARFPQGTAPSLGRP